MWYGCRRQLLSCVAPKWVLAEERREPRRPWRGGSDEVKIWRRRLTASGHNDHCGCGGRAYGFADGVSRTVCRVVPFFAALQMLGCDRASTTPPVGLSGSMPSVARVGAAYAYCTRGDDSLTYWIWMHSAEGDSCWELVEGEQPALSPDGAAVAFHRDGDIWIRDGQGMQTSRITRGGHWFFPSWSSSGRYLAFDRTLPPDSAGIWTCDLQEGRKLIYWGWLCGRGMMPTWSPDEKELAYVKYVGERLGLFIMDLEHHANREVPQRVSQEASHPAWSPDGTRIAFATSTSIAVVDATSGNGRVLRSCTMRSWDTDRYVAWLPDSRRILYSDANLWIVDVAQDVRSATQCE